MKTVEEVCGSSRAGCLTQSLKLSSENKKGYRHSFPTELTSWQQFFQVSDWPLTDIFFIGSHGDISSRAWSSCCFEFLQPDTGMVNITKWCWGSSCSLLWTMLTSKRKWNSSHMSENIEQAVVNLTQVIHNNWDVGSGKKPCCIHFLNTFLL